MRRNVATSKAKYSEPLYVRRNRRAYGDFDDPSSNIHPGARSSFETENFAAGRVETICYYHASDYVMRESTVMMRRSC